jgi:hypothetical protein
MTGTTGVACGSPVTRPCTVRSRMNPGARPRSSPRVSLAFAQRRKRGGRFAPPVSLTGAYRRHARRSRTALKGASSVPWTSASSPPVRRTTFGRVGEALLDVALGKRIAATEWAGEPTAEARGRSRGANRRARNRRGLDVRGADLARRRSARRYESGSGRMVAMSFRVTAGLSL